MSKFSKLFLELRSVTRVPSKSKEDTHILLKGVIKQCTQYPFFCVAM